MSGRFTELGKRLKDKGISFMEFREFRKLKKDQIPPIPKKCKAKLAEFLVNMFEAKPDDAGWLGIDFEYKDKIHRFLVKEYQEGGL